MWCISKTGILKTKKAFPSHRLQNNARYPDLRAKPPSCAIRVRVAVIQQTLKKRRPGWDSPSKTAAIFPRSIPAKENYNY